MPKACWPSGSRLRLSVFLAAHRFFGHGVAGSSKYCGQSPRGVHFSSNASGAYALNVKHSVPRRVINFSSTRTACPSDPLAPFALGARVAALNRLTPQDYPFFGFPGFGPKFPDRARRVSRRPGSGTADPGQGLHRAAGICDPVDADALAQHDRDTWVAEE